MVSFSGYYVAYKIYYIKGPVESLQYFLKVFPLFKIRLWYDKIIVQKQVPYYVVIMCINCGKNIGCSLDNQVIEYFITDFVTNMVFHNVGLSWIVT